MAVPITPIRTPCAMKMFRTCALRVPIDMSTAMSLVFSMTIMIREIRMFNAATKTIRPMVMKVTRRSRRRAWNRGLVLFHPVGGHEAVAGGVFELAGDFVGLVDVVNFEFDYGDQVAQAEEALRVGEAGEGPGGIVVVEAGVEDSDYAEAAVFGNHAEGREFSLRAGDEDDGADGCAEIVGHVFAEDDRWHGGYAGVNCREGIGGRFGWWRLLDSRGGCPYVSCFYFWDFIEGGR